MPNSVCDYTYINIFFKQSYIEPCFIFYFLTIHYAKIVIQSNAFTSYKNIF